MAGAFGKGLGNGFIVDNKGLMWFLTFGSLEYWEPLLFIIPNVVFIRPKGIKNDGIYV